MAQYGQIRGTYYAAAPAGSVFLTVYSVWHRRSASTASGLRNLLKYNYWRTSPPQRSWLEEPGFDPKTATGAANGHFGLVGLHERAKRLDAKLTIESAPGTGTRVAVEIPHFDGATEPAAAPDGVGALGMFMMGSAPKVSGAFLIAAKAPAMPPVLYAAPVNPAIPADSSVACCWSRAMILFTPASIEPEKLSGPFGITLGSNSEPPGPFIIACNSWLAFTSAFAW
jgi:hypothetical protein